MTGRQKSTHSKKPSAEEALETLLPSTIVSRPAPRPRQTGKTRHIAPPSAQELLAAEYNELFDKVETWKNDVIAVKDKMAANRAGKAFDSGLVSCYCFHCLFAC